MPRLTAAELLRALGRTGWQPQRQTGSDVILKHSTHPGRATVAKHPGIIIKPKTLASILDEVGLTSDELRDLL